MNLLVNIKDYFFKKIFSQYQRELTSLYNVLSYTFWNLLMKSKGCIDTDSNHSGDYNQ